MASIPQRNKIQPLEKLPSEQGDVNSNPKSNTNRETQIESLSSFMEATTLHGARFLCSGSIFRRFLWSLALISCFSFCIYQLYKTMDAFYNRPFITKITIKTANENHLPFPAVTLCNFNSFNRRRYKNLMTKNNLSSEDIERNLNIFAGMLSGSQEIFNNKSRQQYPYLFWRVYGDVQGEDHYLTLFSHHIEEMLLPSPTFDSCDISGKNCGSKNFTPFISSVFGQCFTFNSGQDHQPVINATMAGHLNGLKLLLNIETDSYLENPVNPFVGLKVLVHDQQTFPFMEQFGFDVQPGVRTLCAIKRKRV